jgi:hypothetical protein
MAEHDDTAYEAPAVEDVDTTHGPASVAPTVISQID